MSKKRAMSLLLALALCLCLFPTSALAYGTKSLTLKDVYFTAAPIGIAKIQRQTEDWEVNFENVYVFDRDCMAFLKDGREFTYYEWAAVTRGIGDLNTINAQVFQFSADNSGVDSIGIGGNIVGEDGYGFVEVCNMVSKAFLDTLIAGDIEGLTVEYQPMDEHVILQVSTANESSLVVQGMAAVETMQYEGESVSVYSLPTTGVVDFYPVGPVHSVTVSTTVVQDGVLVLKEGETPATWEYTTEEAWRVYFAPDGTEAPNEIAIIEYKDNGELVATIGLRLASAEEQPTNPAPETPTEPETPKAKTAKPTNDKLSVNGELSETATIYKIGSNNYFKLRDVAALLSGTSCQFDVGYKKGTVIITTGKGYSPEKGDLKGAATANKKTVPSSNTILIDGVEVELEAYNIGGNNYFKLRDLGKALGFTVGYKSGVATITTD